MNTSLSNNLTLQLARSLKKAHRHSHGEVKKPAVFNTGRSEQQARLDAEKLHEWRQRMKQIRAKNNH